ncbi:hypothetical protein DPMN_103990 [Dreissena polymorpha]|uniref:Uncharacterized protein n=1 Tax=Dreissena polymorpha TaxID=45954 RepID=A0A9D4H6X7_DREPO|nr:hypothetical protein DPMN_103990 [Dreissena polymorpha]
MQPIGFRHLLYEIRRPYGISRIDSTFLNVDENRNISDQTEDLSKIVNVDEQLKDQNDIPETPKDELKV